MPQHASPVDTENKRARQTHRRRRSNTGGTVQTHKRANVIPAIEYHSELTQCSQITKWQGRRRLLKEANEGGYARAASLLTVSEIERGDVAHLSELSETPSLIYLGGKRRERVAREQTPQVMMNLETGRDRTAQLKSRAHTQRWRSSCTSAKSAANTRHAD